MLKVIPLQKVPKMTKALKEADVFEIWADKLSKKDSEKIVYLAGKLKKPLIYKVTAKDFLKLNKTVLIASEYIDIDSECAKSFIKKIKKENAKAKIIISHHDFKETPYDKEIKKIIAKMLKNKPDVIKLALFARSVSDSFRILDFLQDLNKKSIQSICIGMGEYGLLTRLSGDLFGNYMSYFALDENSKSAPDQITIQEFKKYRNES